MNSVLEEIYSTIIPSAPYLIAAYVLLLAVLFIFMFMILRGVKKSEAQIKILEEQIAEKEADRA